jgi:transketolase C-terminal domain/subunit
VLQTKRELGKATCDAFGRALGALGEEYVSVVIVDADVSNSTRTAWFGKKHPDRFFNIGIAESNLVEIASYCLLGRVSPISFMSICKSSQVSFLAAGFRSR